MTESKYGNIPDELFENYLQSLIGKVYKILCMKDEVIEEKQEEKNLKKYLESFQIELIGNIDLIKILKCDANFLVLLGTLEYLINNDANKSIYKREVFKCISIVKKLKVKYFGGGGF